MFLLSGSPSHVGGINLRQNNGEAEASPPDKAGRAAGLAGPACAAPSDGCGRCPQLGGRPGRREVGGGGGGRREKLGDP